ncbi:MAG: hypothetical protein WCO79_01750 [bacterium]
MITVAVVALACTEIWAQYLTRQPSPTVGQSTLSKALSDPAGDKGKDDWKALV